MPDGISPAAPLLGVANSLSGRFWTLNPVEESVVGALAHKLGGDDLIARLLAARQILPGDVAGFLNPTLKETFPDPFSFADMEKAADLTLGALAEGQKITVFADYDVDGGTSAAILTRYFRSWGQELGLYVPDRLKEGYGPTPEAFRALKASGVDLVITVDCGAAARDALEVASEIGLAVIVLDHHLMQGSLPPAAALVNPNRPDCTSGCGHLAGAGVAFVFIAAINARARQKGRMPSHGKGDALPNLMQWLDLCALGTLCDMAPLKGVNRAFSRQGLKIMQAGQNVGLRALADIAGIGEVNSVYHATFMLGPRLNAGGRIGDPWLAAKLLSTDDWGEAVALAEQLHALNDDRKAVEADILERATAQAERALAKDPARCVIVASGEGWHPGVIGIVAGRLKDKFHMPAIVIGWGEGLGPIAKGSARSVKGVNIGEAISAGALEGLLLSGGGHAMAGGLSVLPEQIDAFDAWINRQVSVQGEDLAAARQLSVDGVIGAGAATVELAEKIEQIGPFGAGAPRPVFAIDNVLIRHSRTVGADHLKLDVEDATGRLECIAWRHANSEMGQSLKRGARAHLVGEIRTNIWNNQVRVQLDVRDSALVDN